MMENMQVRVEVWPLAADSSGIWLLSGDDAWRSIAVPSDSEPHHEVSLVLATHGHLEHTAMIHSTSWRTDGPAVVLTYIAVITCPDVALDLARQAQPVSPELLAAVGPAPTHSAIEAPAPRYIDVLVHGIRHLRYLLDHDATTAAALDDRWRAALTPLRPAIAAMYSQAHAG